MYHRDVFQTGAKEMVALLYSCHRPDLLTASHVLCSVGRQGRTNQGEDSRLESDSRLGYLDQFSH